MRIGKREKGSILGLPLLLPQVCSTPTPSSGALDHDVLEIHEPSLHSLCLPWFPLLAAESGGDWRAGRMRGLAVYSPIPPFLSKVWQWLNILT